MNKSDDEYIYKSEINQDTAFLPYSIILYRAPKSRPTYWEKVFSDGAMTKLGSIYVARTMIMRYAAQKTWEAKRAKKKKYSATFNL